MLRDKLCWLPFPEKLTKRAKKVQLNLNSKFHQQGKIIDYLGQFHAEKDGADFTQS